jgi:TRAP transporter TAXI family solute receptor
MGGIMRQKRTNLNFVLIVTFFIISIAFVKQAYSQEKPVSLSMATFKSGSGWYIMAQAMAKVMEKALPPGSKVDVLPYSGGVGNPLLLHKGKADIALGFPVETGLAISGEAPYKEPLRELRLLAGGFDGYWYVFAVREKTGITNLQEIKAKKYPLRLVVLPKGSSGEWMTNKVLQANDMTFDDLKSWGGNITHTSFPTAVEMVKDGQADAFGQVCTPGHPSWTQLATMTKLTFLPTKTKSLIEKYNFRSAVVPKGSFRGVKEDVPVLGFSTCIITTEGLPIDVAYKITKSICSNKQALVETYKAAEAFDPNKAWEVPLPLHSGAIKFYKEVGYMK